MPAGVLTDQGVTGIHDDPDRPPPPDAQRAPKGWTWDRKGRAWKPKIRGRKIPTPEPASTPPEHPAGDPGPAGVDGPAGPGTDPDPPYLRGGDEGQDHEREPGPAADDDRIPFDDVPQQVKDDIAGLAGLVGTPILAMLRSLDPYCGTVLAENYEPIVDAALPLICRSSKIVRYFAEDKADWLLWGKLAMALKPVGQAILQHHIFRTVVVDRDPATGIVTVVRVTEGGGPGRGDPLQPNVNPAQYAA